MPAALTRRQLLRVGITAVPVLVAACSSEPSTPAGGQSQAAKPGGSGTAPAAPAKSGGAVSFAISSDPLLNPILTGDISGVPVNKLLFNGLTRPDAETLEPKPDLALSWEPSNGGATWTFRLRSGVTWHDGAPFTADDVKFTFDLILDPNVNTVMRGNFKSLQSVEVVDPLTVRINLSQPFAAFPSFTGHMGTSCLGILPKHLLAGQDINTAEFNKTRAVGTGAFKLKEYQSADHVTLVANDAYHFGRPKLDSFTWKILPDVNTQLSQVRTGELTEALQPPAAVQPLKGNADFKVDYAPRVGVSYVGLNKSRPLFQDPKVRKAMMYALDRDAIVSKIFFGAYTVATGPIPPVIAWAYEPNVPRYSFDLDKAKNLMAEAGWRPGPDGVLAKDGQRFAFKLTSSSTLAGARQVTAELQQRWKALGMESEIELLEFGTFISQRRDNHNYDVMLHSWSLPLDPDQFNYWHSSSITGGLNAGEYRNPRVDQLLEEGRRTLDPARRKEIYSQFQQLMADDLPELWLWNNVEVRAGSSRLQGLGKNSYYDVGLHYATDWAIG
jgi:peptide/nickel transport system substrate-binding protein